MYGPVGQIGVDENPAAIRGVLGDVLFSVRFPLMATEQFGRGVAKSGILTAEEVVEVLLWRTIRDKPTSFSCEPRGQARRSRFEKPSSGNYMENGSWCANDLCVTVHRSYGDESLQYHEGVIRFTTEENCDVWFDEMDMDAVVPREYLRPVRPVIGDVARIIHGEDVGLSGNVISKDGSEVVIKMDCGVRLIHFKFLCKVS
ncbi:micro-fibrillar-associated protein 1 containing protein [Aphelenchoides avenae]|nr:micro-fibrillar-associated protein 1 containing protein [Aphelenchus avenae]